MHTRLDLSTLTRFSLKDCSLKPHANGEFVSYAALERAIEKEEMEREAVSFLRGAAPVPSVRARVVTWMRGVFMKTER
jgi:hypothetical protein